jgi:hypothetical protein
MSYVIININNKEKLMPSRKFVIINGSNNIVGGVVMFDDSNMLEQGLIAGILSEPDVIEVSPYSKSSIGWKYINGVEYAPEGLGANT